MLTIMNFREIVLASIHTLIIQIIHLLIIASQQVVSMLEYQVKCLIKVKQVVIHLTIALQIKEYQVQVIL